MANIVKLSSPAYGKDVADKLNEVIDWLNGKTDSQRVTNITVSGKTLTVTYINGDKDTFTLADTTYTLATTIKNGLAHSSVVASITSLTRQIQALNKTCAVLESYNAYIDSHTPDPDDGGGGGDGDGPDSGGGDGDDGGDDGGHGGGGGDF